MWLFGRFWGCGQVTGRSAFGRWIYLTALDEAVRTVVEIGTWKGCGSTRLLHKAGKLRKGQLSSISLEVNERFFKIASRNLPRNSTVALLWGTIVSADELDRDGLSEEENRWIVSDLADLKKAPNVKDQLPISFDSLILDGGEFSSEKEFRLLANHVTKWIILDDIFVRKNRKVHTALAASEEFVMVAKGSDRNGWSIWMRVPGAKR